MLFYFVLYTPSPDRRYVFVLRKEKIKNDKTPIFVSLCRLTVKQYLAFATGTTERTGCREEKRNIVWKNIALWKFKFKNMHYFLTICIYIGKYTLTRRNIRSLNVYILYFLFLKHFYTFCAHAFNLPILAFSL